MSSPSPTTAPPLLVRLPNPLGDALMATPLLTALHRAEPARPLVLAGRPAQECLFRGLPGVTDYLPLEAAWGPGEESRALRRAGAGTVLLLPNSWSSALAAWRAGIPRRIGRRRHGRRLLLHRALPPVGEPRSMRALYLDFLDALAVAPEVQDGSESDPLVVATPGTPRTTLPDAPLLAAAPGAAFGPSKLYPPARLAEVLRTLAAEDGLHPVLLGAPDERPLLEEVAAAVGPAAILPAAGDMDLAESSAILARAAVFLGSDAGSRHLASAHGVPQVVWYGPNDPRWSAHDLGRLTVLQVEGLDCLGCALRDCPLADHPCMERLPAARLVEAVRRARRNPGA